MNVIVSKVTSRFARKIIIFIVFLALILWIPTFAGRARESETGVVFAADEPTNSNEFSTSYDVAYDVGLDGITTVTEKITLKNLTSQYYATQFSLTIGSTQITDVLASDSGGSLEINKGQKDTSTTLNVKFNQQVAGLGKELPWTLSYKSKDFASQQGKVWEVTLPKIVSGSSLSAYNVTLSVPTGFGPLTSISPNPIKQTTSFDRLFLNFNKDQLINSGVSANFGDKQLFDFDLSYHLENPNLTPIITNITLPPDSAYQDVVFTRIDPKPENVTVDDDGNYLAWYRLSRNQKLDIKVVGFAKLYINTKVKNPELPIALKQKYLQPQKYWDSNNPVFKTKLSEILSQNTPASSIEKAKLIHRYVVNNLKYDTGRLNGSNIERLGAVTALNNPNSAVCMEFTDLFIALSRAAGIPARELDGYAYTANSTLRPLSLNRDVLHAWPEFWDDTKGWIMIDPTWENTTGGVDYFSKFDLNHFVFVTKGISSQEPIPAGSYKYIGQDSQDVKVKFTDNDFLGKPQIDVVIDTQSPIIAGFPGKIKVKISNNGNALEQSGPLNIKAGQLTILNSISPDSGPIPAFGKAEFEINARTKSLLDSYDDVIEVTVAGQKFRKAIQVRPFLVFQNFPLVLIGLVGGIGLIYFGVLGGFVYRKRFLKREKVVVKK